jgi:hypothetical protein
VIRTGQSGESGGGEKVDVVWVVCGQAEGKKGQPTITTVFEHYYLVRAFSVAGRVSLLDAERGIQFVLIVRVA